MCPSAPRVCSEPGGQKPVLSLSLDRIGTCYSVGKPCFDHQTWKKINVTDKIDLAPQGKHETAQTPEEHKFRRLPVVSRINKANVDTQNESNHVYDGICSIC